MPHEWSAVALSCFRKIRRWRVPPRWSPRDWFEEIGAELTIAALMAARDYNPARGVPPEAFLRRRIMGTAYTRYRREWQYALRQVSGAELDWHQEGTKTSPTPAESEAGFLFDALDRLSSPDSRLIEGLFWGKKTEVELAKVLGISQQAVNKRKRSIFRTLHRLIDELAKDADDVL
jgi:DNA-directed RNA polymerase specialized sigma24 family protein